MYFVFYEILYKIQNGAMTNIFSSTMSSNTVTTNVQYI